MRWDPPGHHSAQTDFSTAFVLGLSGESAWWAADHRQQVRQHEPIRSLLFLLSWRGCISHCGWQAEMQLLLIASFHWSRSLLAK